MDGSPAHGALELEVTDFGPIAKAKIDLRPLTVFVGPSNTGKSYLSILIYALHRSFSGGPILSGQALRDRIHSLRTRPKPSDETAKALLKMARSHADNPVLRDGDAIVLSSPAADALRSDFNEKTGPFIRALARCFGISKADALVRKGKTSGARVVLRRRVAGISAPVEHVLTLAARKAGFEMTIPVGEPIPFHAEQGDGMDHYVDHIMHFMDDVPAMEDTMRQQYAASDFLERLGDLLLPAMFGPLHLRAHYLPADRTGVMHSYNVIVSSLIANAPMAGLHSAVRTPMLSGVLADFLEQLIGIYRYGDIRRMPEDLGAGIETALLSGEVRVDRSDTIDYPRFSYRPEGWKDDLALTNASSMVSELAPVVLYLRHVIGPGDVLIIEEPESHLHPAMQVEFTRQLAALVGAGIRVVVTTHSEWLLEELANIVQRSGLPDSEHANNGESDVALRPDQVGAWLFEPKQRPKGSVVKEIRFEDSGLYPSGYEDVAAALHNDWAEISSRIEGGS